MVSVDTFVLLRRIRRHPASDINHIDQHYGAIQVSLGVCCDANRITSSP
jgi:hypothetical protein